MTTCSVVEACRAVGMKGICDAQYNGQYAHIEVKGSSITGPHSRTGAHERDCYMTPFSAGHNIRRPNWPKPRQDWKTLPGMDPLSYKGVFTYWGSSFQNGRGQYGNGHGKACSPCEDARCADVNISLTRKSHRNNCLVAGRLPTKEQIKCDQCIGRHSFVSGTGNSTYFALCAKPVQ